MQILDIVLYGDEGRVRSLSLHPNQLNVITGASKTGKSALSNIIEYCLGRDHFLIPAGIITNHVRWYGLRLQFPSTQVFVARQAPRTGESVSSAVCFIVGSDLSIPTHDQLAKNINAKEMREKLGRLLHIEPNLNVPEENETRLPLEANISHALLLNFQQQGEVADQHFLFHRQGEPFMPQAIKDTLPYFLGAVKEGHLARMNELRRARRELARAEKRKREADNLRGDGISKGLSLLAEAEELGLIQQGLQPSDIDTLRQALSIALQWKPQQLPSISGDTLSRLQDERSSLYADHRNLRQRIKAAKNCAEGQASFAFEAREQKIRLQAISLYQEPTSDTSICPICQSVLETSPPNASEFQIALDRISAQLNNVTAESPRLREQIDAMEEQLSEVNRRLDENKQAVNALVAQRPDVSEIVAANTRMSRVIGKIQFYLESLVLTGQQTATEEELVRIKSRVEELEEELSNANTEELLPSILNNVSRRIETYAQQLELEYSDVRFRFDMTNLTIIADTENGPVPLARMGSGANWLGYHLATHVALHDWFIQKQRPVPRFLLLDQPSQAYYPQDRNVELALENDEDGSLSFLDDDDRIAVRRVFRWLYDKVREFSPNFQIIVTDHADIAEKWFSDSVVQRWRGDEKLIPQDWL
jgi:hypothetical protein